MKKMKFQVLLEKHPTKYTPIMKFYYWLIFPLITADLSVIMSFLNSDLSAWNDLMKLISGFYLLLYLVTLALDLNLRQKEGPEYRYWNFL
ncbi:hypothetical protein [Xylocopilactobacillus apis]|uniref:Uncharacterized protein n=1 Tax=Xylocopilactobacillus apis TaxID=2932183 RepID=A0AAU9CST1_9LACO|nr:hypothetical protein [Xylocopilactobacillus apis]BDR57052.1 hypothetical protein KIMC2_16140 [Xylocopilactobacillus apis]